MITKTEWSSGVRFSPANVKKPAFRKQAFLKAKQYNRAVAGITKDINLLNISLFYHAVWTVTTHCCLPPFRQSSNIFKYSSAFSSPYFAAKGSFMLYSELIAGSIRYI